jgi:hypothetical protein
LQAGLISDLPVADERGGQVLPRGLHVKRVTEDFAPRGVEASARNFLRRG